MSRKGQGSRPGGGQSGRNREQRKQERVGRGQGGGGGGGVAREGAPGEPSVQGVSLVAAGLGRG